MNQQSGAKVERGLLFIIFLPCRFGHWGILGKDTKVLRLRTDFRLLTVGFGIRALCIQSPGPGSPTTRATSQEMRGKAVLNRLGPSARPANHPEPPEACSWNPAANTKQTSVLLLNSRPDAQACKPCLRNAQVSHYVKNIST